MCAIRSPTKMRTGSEVQSICRVARNLTLKLDRIMNHLNKTSWFPDGWNQITKEGWLKFAFLNHFFFTYLCLGIRSSTVDKIELHVLGTDGKGNDRPTLGIRVWKAKLWHGARRCIQPDFPRPTPFQMFTSSDLGQEEGQGNLRRPVWRVHSANWGCNQSDLEVVGYSMY